MNKDAERWCVRQEFTSSNPYMYKCSTCSKCKCDTDAAKCVTDMQGGEGRTFRESTLRPGTLCMTLAGDAWFPVQVVEWQFFTKGYYHGEDTRVGADAWFVKLRTLPHDADMTHSKLKAVRRDKTTGDIEHEWLVGSTALLHWRKSKLRIVRTKAVVCTLCVMRGVCVPECGMDAGFATK